jgi:ABC-type dipeptide/oligopeptide/nickel transport system permease subunit
MTQRPILMNPLTGKEETPALELEGLGLDAQGGGPFAPLLSARGRRRLALFFGLLFFLTVLAPFLCPHDPFLADLSLRLRPPSLEHPLGTDQLGRCVLSRLLYGARGTLGTALAVAALVFAFGSAFGLLAGFSRGAVDFAAARAIDLALAFPAALMAVAAASLWSPSRAVLALSLSAVWWGPTARFARDLTKGLKGRDYVLSARLSGLSGARIAVRHILPDVAGKTLMLTVVKLPSVITGVAAFSFLGLGAQPPDPDWGALLADGRRLLGVAPLLSLWPALGFFLLTLCLTSLLGGEPAANA